jgi:hypothetical protein
MSRHWRRVSMALQKLAAGLHAVKSEGMFPYETHYVLATDEELERLCDWGTAMDQHFVRLAELPNENPNWSRYTPVVGVDSKKADGRIRLVPARTTLHARAGAKMA